MPIYNIQGPDGRIYSLEGPEGATEDQVVGALRSMMPGQAAPKTERSFGEAALDIPASALSGIGGLLQFPGQLVKLVPGMGRLGEAIEKPGEFISEAGQSLKSEGLKAREALRSKAMSEAEKEGILSEFATAITSTIKDPALLTSFVAEQVPLLIGPAGAAKIAQKIGAKSIEAAGAGLTGAAAEEAVKAAAQRVGRTSVGAAYGTGTAMQSADVSSDAYNEAYKRAIEKGMSEEDALDVAANAGRVAALGAAGISLLAQRLPGAKAIEKRLAGVPGTAGKLGSAVGEAASEAVEEGGGQFFKNLGLRQITPEQSLTEGIGGAAGLGALGGGLLGGALGKKAEEPRFEGQQEGESDRAFAARLQQEIAAGLRPAEPPAEPPAAPAGPTLPGDQQLFTLAAQPNGYGMLENLKQRLIADASIPQDQKKPVIDNILSIQERMNIEQVDRLRAKGQPPAPLLPTDTEAEQKAMEMDLGKLGMIVENMGKSIPAYQAVLADPQALKKEAKKGKLSVEEAQSRYQQHIEYINSVLPVYTQVLQQRRQQQQQTSEADRAQAIANLTPEQQAIRSQAESLIKELEESGVPEFVNFAEGAKNNLPRNNFKTEKDIELLKSKVESYRNLKQSATAPKPVDEISLEYFNKDHPDDLVKIQEASKDQRLADLFARVNDVMGRGAKAINALGMSWSGVDARSPIDMRSVKDIVDSMGGGVGRLVNIKQAIDKGYNRASNDPAKLEQAIRDIEADIETANQRIAKVQALAAPAPAPAAPKPPVQEKVKKVEGPKPKGMPLRAQELPQPPAPVTQEAKEEAAARKPIEQDIRKTLTESNKAARESKSLWGQLIGQLDRREVRDISPDRRLAPLNKKGGGGFFLDYFVDGGMLDEFLPPDMRHNSATFDSTESQEYVKDIIRRGEPSGYITWDAKQKIAQNDISIEQMEKLLRSLNTEEINAQLQEVNDERRREEEANAEVSVPPAGGEGATAKEPTGEPPVRKSLSEVAKNVPEGKFRELERKAKAPKETEPAEAPKAEEQKAPEAPKAEEPRAISPEIQQKIETLNKVLRKNLAKYGLKDIDLNLEQGMADEGSFSGQLIRIALDSPDPLGILRHESIHALKEAGFFTDKQWASLERMADDKWIDQFLKGQEVEYNGQRMSRFDAYMQEYAGNVALIREEAIADAFRNFSKKQPAGLMGALTTRMKNFFKAVKSAFNSQGIESAEDIFGKIEEGKLEAAPAKAEKPAEERKSLRASDDRFNSKEIDEMRAPGYKSKEKLIEMPISDFLQLAEEGYDERKMQNARKLLAEGKQFSSIPFLVVERKDENNPSIYKTVGHEGRHRARALEELGYKTIPVILKTDFIRWSEQNDPDKFDYREVWPSRLDAEENASNPYFSIPFPVRREDSEKPYGETERKSLRAPDTAAFKKWFGDSKVVDENGEPLVMYHGTTADFNVFDTTRRAIAGEGSFFSSSPMGSFAAGAGGNIMPAYLSIKNPKVIDLARESDDVFKDRFIKQGHDGVVMMFEGKIQTAVAFYPEQIKSATGNIGTFEPTSPDIRKSLRTPNDNIVDLTQRRTQQLRAEFEREHADMKGMLQEFQRREDLRFLVEEASPFFKSVVNQVQLAREVYDRLAPMVQTDIRPALYKYDRMWKNYMTAVYGDDSTMYGSPFEEKAQNSTFLATSNLRPDIKDVDEFKSHIRTYLQEVTDYANSLSNRSPRQKEFKKELLNVLNRPVVNVKFSMRSIPVINPATEARINDTIRPRRREGFVDRMIEAISPKMFSYFREQLVNEYNEAAELDKRVAAQIKRSGGAQQLADEKAEVACLFSSQAAAVASSALGAHNRKGGIPVYKNGVVTVDTSGDNEGPVVIFAPLASTGDPRTFQHYQFWAAVNRAKKYIQNPGQTRYVEQTFEKDDIDLAEELRKQYAAQGIDFKDIQKRWNKYNNGLVKLMRDTGTISERAARDFIAHADYFPFYRQVDEENMVGPKTFSTIAGTKPPKAAKGSEEPLGDFFETVVRNTQAAISLAMKNVAGQRVTSQALRINEVVRLSENPQVSQISGNTWGVFDSQYADTISAPDQAAALAAARAKYGATATVDASPTQTGQWNVFKAVQIGEVDAVNAQEAREEANTNYKYRPDVFVYRVFENGQPVYYRAYDIKLINALKALNTTDLPFLGLLSAPANALRTLVTKEPGYMLVNQMRDSLSAWVTSGVKMTPIADSARQFAKSISKNSPEMEALFNAGVIGGYEYAHGARESGEFLEKQIRRKAGVKSVTEKVTSPFTSLWGAMERGTQVSDGATRAEVYKRVLEETGNEAEALWQAAEVLNFYRHGRSPVIRVLTAIVPFMNSRIQGLDVLYRAGIRPAIDALATDEQRQRMKTFWVRGMTMMALSSMYWMLTHDDDEYKKQEQETRDNYWLIPSLGIKIAIPFEIGVMFKVLPERILENVFGSDTGKDSIDSLKRQLESTLMFTIIPQALMPYYEVSTNFSFFTQRPIIGQGMEGVAPRFQVAPGTSSLAQLIADKLAIETTEDSSSFTKGLASSLEISPIKLDHLIKGYTGTIGQYAVELFDAIYNLNNDVPKPSKRFEQLPIIKRLALDPDARGTVTAFYDLKNSVDEVVRTSNLLERTMKPEQYAEYLSQNMGILANRDYVLSLEKSMKEFREMKNLVRNSDMTGDEKRDLLLTISQAENDLTANIREVRSLSMR